MNYSATLRRGASVCFARGVRRVTKEAGGASEEGGGKKKEFRGKEGREKAERCEFGHAYKHAAWETTR